MTLNLQRIGWVLFLAGSPLLFGDSPSGNNVNHGGPPVEKRNFTKAEIENTLRALGVSPGSSGPISCHITDSSGNTVTQVTASALFGGPFYWLYYDSAGVSARSVQFVLFPMFTGSPLAGQKQLFLPNSNTNIYTPFGIPSWFDNLTSGPWMLVVHNDLGQQSSCGFTVVP